VVAEGVPEGVCRRYVRAQNARSRFTSGVCLILLTAFALGTNGATMEAAVYSCLAVFWLLPPLLRFFFRAEFAAVEQVAAPQEVREQVRAVAATRADGAAPLSLPVDAVMVDASPNGLEFPFAAYKRGLVTLSRKLLDIMEPVERDFLVRREMEYEADRAGRMVGRRWYAAAYVLVAAPLALVVLMAALDTFPTFLPLFLAIILLPLAGVAIFLFVARHYSVTACLRAGDRALAATRDVGAALSGVRKVGDLQTPPFGLRLFFEAPPTVKEQVRALEEGAVRLGVRPPSVPPKGIPSSDIPMDPS
jgi:Zn-dependent protease with chaperone function